MGHYYAWDVALMLWHLLQNVVLQRCQLPLAVMLVNAPSCSVDGDLGGKVLDPLAGWHFGEQATCATCGKIL